MLFGYFGVFVQEKMQEIFVDVIWDYLFFVCGFYGCLLVKGGFVEQFEYVDVLICLFYIMIDVEMVFKVKLDIVENENYIISIGKNVEE